LTNEVGTVHMKVQLIVVQGRPEGKVIPLVGPKFKIGRGETCHLRPNSEQVSREHAEFTLTADTVSVRDLGSRNGTLVNGKALTESCALKDRDLVQVGPLTFAVSIQGAPASTKPAEAGSPAKAAPEDVSHDDIEAWLISDTKNPAPERPSGVYGGDTITITAFKDSETPKPEAAVDPDASDEEYERLPEGEGDPEPDAEAVEEDDDEAAASDEMPEDLIDESNPFYVKKKAPEPTTPSKPTYKDTSDAASDILKKMMERRRGPR
jgi:pSer/pThr/pTyr-binding forkhead associated (FHA) protein